MTSQGGRYCTRCNRMTLHTHQGISNVLHLLLTVFTIGLWLPIWIILGIGSAMAKPVCQVCGSTESLSKREHESFKLTR